MRLELHFNHFLSIDIYQGEGVFICQKKEICWEGVEEVQNVLTKIN